MRTTDVLRSEHRVIASLEIAARTLEAGGEVRPGFFLDLEGCLLNTSKVAALLAGCARRLNASKLARKMLAQRWRRKPWGMQPCSFVSS